MLSLTDSFVVLNVAIICKASCREHGAAPHETTLMVVMLMSSSRDVAINSMCREGVENTWVHLVVYGPQFETCTYKNNRFFQRH